MIRIDIAGQRFGKLVVLEEAESYERSDGRFDRRVRSLCDCGQICIHRVADLRDGSARSCGCSRREGFTTFIHGEARRNNKTPEYQAWTDICRRCTNPDFKQWKDYGGRGIRVCDEWLNSFDAFLSHVGRKPSPKHSIDRIDNDGHYEPGNVRWATRSEQERNKRRGHQIHVG